MSKLIAIVDDETEMEELYEFLLEDLINDYGVKVKFFSDSRMFELWMRFNLPDLILTDISMPYLSGPELGHRIRETGHNILTYFVSGHDEKDFKTSMKELGVSRYLSKPINTSILIEYLKSDLGLEGPR